MEYLFKNYKGRNKEKLVQIARISVIIFTCVFCLMFRENNNLFNPGDYAVTIVDSDEYKGKYYSGVVTELQRNGFRNIKTVAMGDLITGWITEENTVDSVTIGGKPFVKGKVYQADKVSIVVKYHSKKQYF
ncbi:MAG: hypothetical protein II567_13935 [Candidatus Riflebacteria bacterium]|nr:hypothetical protein [Candidatus Riflebacteria bacterium]